VVGIIVVVGVMVVVGFIVVVGIMVVVGRRVVVGVIVVVGVMVVVGRRVVVGFIVVVGIMVVIGVMVVVGTRVVVGVSIIIVVGIIVVGIKVVIIGVDEVGLKVVGSKVVGSKVVKTISSDIFLMLSICNGIIVLVICSCLDIGFIIKKLMIPMIIITKITTPIFLKWFVFSFVCIEEFDLDCTINFIFITIIIKILNSLYLILPVAIAKIKTILLTTRRQDTINNNGLSETM
jgi:hypothetical protein